MVNGYSDCFGADDGGNGGDSMCYENDVNGDLIGQAVGGEGGIRYFSRGGAGSFGSTTFNYGGICDIKYGINGEEGHQLGIATPYLTGGYGGKSYFGKGGRGANEVSVAESGVLGGGGGATI